jgi:hypothetical protein
MARYVVVVEATQDEDANPTAATSIHGVFNSYASAKSFAERLQPRLNRWTEKIIAEAEADDGYLPSAHASAYPMRLSGPVLRDALAAVDGAT